jgi:hypothetical protein
MTNYLRFPDETTGISALTDAGLYIEPAGDNLGHFRQADHDFAMDVIGIISEGSIYSLETGEELEPPTILEGWHVNYIGTLPDSWEQYVVSPASPVRKFAGVD